MTAAEYTRVTNRVNVSRALSALRDVCPGEDDLCGVTANELKRITRPLAQLEKKLFPLITTEEVDTCGIYD